MKKVACFYADGFEEVELLSVVDVLRRAGVQADLISITGEAPVSAHGVAIKADLFIDETAMDEYDVIYIPGGSKGAELLGQKDEVLKAIRDFHELGKKVAAICAGPTVLERAGILKGQAGTSYPSFENELSFETYREDLVVVSNNVITSRGPGTALLLGFEILRELELSDEADRIWQDMLMDKLEFHFKQGHPRH